MKLRPDSHSTKRILLALFALGVMSRRRRLMNMPSFRALTFGVALVLALPSLGVPMSGLCDGTSNGSITCDPITNLEWLDFEPTIGFSPNDFFNNLGGLQAAGWNFALATDGETLLTNAGFTNFNVPPQFLLSQADAAQLMILIARPHEWRSGRGL